MPGASLMCCLGGSGTGPLLGGHNAKEVKGGVVSWGWNASPYQNPCNLHVMAYSVLVWFPASSN